MPERDHTLLAEEVSDDQMWDHFAELIENFTLCDKFGNPRELRF